MAYQVGALIFLAVATAAEAHPATRAFSVLLGGSLWDGGSNVAVDAAGDVWLVGGTGSPDFPFTAGSAPEEIFIARLSPGGELLSATSLGGRDSDFATSIALDSAGNVYVAGSTFSPDFPVTASLARPGARQRVFVVKLDPRGEIVYSTVFGGTRHQHITSLAVDAAGHAFVTGSTDAPDFPMVGALFSSMSGPSDVFVTKLSADGSSLLYSTYLGGSGFDSTLGIAVDAAGSAHVAGFVYPDPETSQAVVAKLNPDGSQLIYSTFLGGSGYDWAKAVALDPAGNALVYGETTSTDFPVREALQPAPVPGPNGEPPYETFLARLGPDGSLLSSTYFGGSGEDGATDIAVDGAGFIYLLGFTASPDFPLRDPLPIDVTPSWYFHVGSVTRLDPQASEVLFSTFLDGTEEAQGWAYGIAVDDAGNIHVAGDSNDPNFPVIGPSQRTGTEVHGDAFALKIELNGSPDCSAAVASPAVLWPANGKLVPVRIGGVTDPDGDPVAVSVTAIRQDEPLSKKGQPDATGLGTSSPRLRADRAGHGDGRVYHVTFSAMDPQDASCTRTITVCVPHDQGKRTCGDGGPLFGSAGQQP